METGFVGRVLRQAGARRARTSEGWPLQCHGCGKALGRQGDKPAENLPFGYGKLYGHRDMACRSRALRRFLSEEKATSE